MLAEVLRLHVFQNLHSVAARQPRVESIRGEAAGAETVRALLLSIFAFLVAIFAGLTLAQWMRVELELLLPVR